MVARFRIMQAIVHHGAGGPEVLSLDEVPTPTPGPGQVLVRVRAAGLNRADIIQRKGNYPAPPGWPADIPGLEYAGEIVALGPEAGRWRADDRVMGLVGGGAQAEFVAVHEDEVLPMPAGLSFEEAAGIPEAFLTAYDALVTRARVAPRERVLVHAVGSGVGTAAVQLIRWLGAVSTGTSRTAAKLEHAVRLGLDRGIDTSTIGFRSTLDAPADVILDFFGGGALTDNLASLAPRGRLVLLGTLQGPHAADVNLGQVLRNRLEIIGTVMRARGRAERVPLVREFEERVIGLFEAGARPVRLEPVVGAVFPLVEVAQAHAAMEANEVFGKIVLTVD